MKAVMIFSSDTSQYLKTIPFHKDATQEQIKKAVYAWANLYHSDDKVFYEEAA